jgi:hypothetical protein
MAAVHQQAFDLEQEKRKARTPAPNAEEEKKVSWCGPVLAF